LPIYADIGTSLGDILLEFRRATGAPLPCWASPDDPTTAAA